METTQKLTSSTENDLATLKSTTPTYYILSWENWSDLQGEKKEKYGFLDLKTKEIEDAAKIDDQSFFLGGKDATGEKKYIARQLNDRNTTVKTFLANTFLPLDGVGQYYPEEDTMKGNLINANEVSSKEKNCYYVDKEFQVLVGKSTTNPEGAYILNWVNWNNSLDNVTADNFLQAGTDSNGNGIFVCLADLAADEAQYTSGFNIGAFNPESGNAFIPDGINASVARTSFQLLAITHVGSVKYQQAYLGQEMAKIAHYAYGLKDSTWAAAGYTEAPATYDYTYGLKIPEKVAVGTSIINNKLALAIGIAGTLDAFIDWVIDFAALPAAFPLNTSFGAKAHAGILDATKVLLSQDGFFTGILSKLEETGIKEIYISGHSQGGGIAVLLAPILKEKLREKGINVSIKVFTYGAPRVCNSVLAIHYPSLVDGCYRFEAASDLVPHVPLSKYAFWPSLLHEVQQGTNNVVDTIDSFKNMLAEFTKNNSAKATLNAASQSVSFFQTDQSVNQVKSELLNQLKKANTSNSSFLEGIITNLNKTASAGDSTPVLKSGSSNESPSERYDLTDLFNNIKENPTEYINGLSTIASLAKPMLKNSNNEGINQSFDEFFSAITWLDDNKDLKSSEDLAGAIIFVFKLMMLLIVCVLTVIFALSISSTSSVILLGVQLLLTALFGSLIKIDTIHFTIDQFNRLFSTLEYYLGWDYAHVGQLTFLAESYPYADRIMYDAEEVPVSYQLIGFFFATAKTISDQGHSLKPAYRNSLNAVINGSNVKEE